MGQGAISSIGQRAAAILNTGAEGSATDYLVAATFERSCYLRSGAVFVCIGDASIGDAPLNVLVEGFAHYRARLRGGSVVRSAGRRLVFDDDVSLTWTDAAIWTMPPWPTADSRSRLTATARQQLLAASPADGLFRLSANVLSGSALPTLTPLHMRAQPAMVALAEGLIAAPPRRAALLETAIHGLIGLGPGLTPSGDDLLAGVLLGLHASQQQAMAALLGRQAAAVCGEGTSALSAALLRCAIAGETSAPLYHVFCCALTNADWPSALDTLNRIGHTSGWDHLAGFLLVSAAVQPRPRT